MAKYKTQVFSKAALAEVARRASDWRFNGRLPIDFVAALPERDYPVELVMPHRHRHGVPCEVHFRCGVVFDGQLRTFDVSQDFYEALPEREFEEDL